MAPITGEEVIAQACQNQGIEFMFGVVGIPVQVHHQELFALRVLGDAPS